MTTLRMIAMTVLGVPIMLAPVSGFAKDNPGKSNGNGNGRGHARVQVQLVEAARDRHVIVQTNRATVGHCPPGLAKKDPACVPPGQARKAAGDGFVVGDVLDLGTIHIINQPSLYGLGRPPNGNRYAIVAGSLVRIDSETGRLLSIIRLVDAILD